MICVYRSLNHVNIVRYFGIYTSPEGDKYIITEFLSKGSLDHLLRYTEDISVIDLLSM
jgi:serine/threonine protein kinase